MHYKLLICFFVVYWYSFPAQLTINLMIQKKNMQMHELPTTIRLKLFVFFVIDGKKLNVVLK